MPRGKRTSINQAAQAKALADIGYQGAQIADAIGLPVRTVDDIINGRTAGVRSSLMTRRSSSTALRPSVRCRPPQSIV